MKKNITIDDLALMMKKGFDGVDKKFDEMKLEMINMEERFDRKLEKMEERFNKRIDHLTKTLDVFLKRMTDMEDEFAMMRNDINRIKKAIKEKLGVELA